MAISMLKIRRPLGRLIFNMGIAIPGKTVFLIETAPRPPLSLHWKPIPHGAKFLLGCWNIVTVVTSLSTFDFYGLHFETKSVRAP